MSDKNNLFGMQVNPPGNPGTWIGKSWRETICAILTCLLRPRIIVPVLDSNGMSVPTDAQITMGKNGWTALLPALGTGAGSSSSGTVPFAGNGVPSAATLAAGNYQSIQPPSLYVDMNAKALYVCTQAGTGATSVWALVSGVGGGGNAGFYDWNKAWPAGSIAQVLNSLTQNGVTVQPGTYVCLSGVPGQAPLVNQVPQYPYPVTGTIFWLYLAPLPVAVQVCSGGNRTIYVAATAPF